jgi:hypothetical protein
VELDGFGYFAWIRMASQSILQEASPYLLICATTAMLSRCHAADTKPILAVAAYSAVSFFVLWRSRQRWKNVT